MTMLLHIKQGVWGAYFDILNELAIITFDITSKNDISVYYIKYNYNKIQYAVLC